MTETEYRQKAWSLMDLFPAVDSSEFQQAKEELEQRLQTLEGYRPSLSPEMGTDSFLEIMQTYESATRLLSRLLYYAHLHFAEDTQDQAAQALLGQMQQLAAQANNRTLFFRLWWKDLEEDQSERFLEGSGDYRYWLEALQLQKPFTLSEPEEKVINLKDVNGPQALVTLYDTLTNRYTFRLQVEGEEKSLTRGELMTYVRGPDRDLRAAAYQELHRVYAQDAAVLGQIYQYIVRDWRSEILTAGGSDSPEHILSRAGIDIHSADFWQGGFAVLETSLQRLEALEIPQ